MINIPKKEQIPKREKLAFSVGSAADYLATGTLTSVLWMPFFNLGLGMNAGLLGVVLMVYRLWDALTDPVMGHISDGARTKWGRRKPFMFVGAILTGCLFPLFWFVPEAWSESWKITYLIVLGMIYFACFTCWSMPYYGLQLELTPNYDERTRLSVWMTAVGKVVWLSGGVLIWAVNLPRFQSVVEGVQAIAIPMGVLIAVVGVLPALFVRERVHVAAEKKVEPFWENIRLCLSCKPLWLLIGVSFFQVFGGMFAGTLSYYVNVFVVNAGNQSIASGWELAKKVTEVGAGLALLPFWIWLAEKWDKKMVAYICLLGGVFAQGLNWVCLRPDMPWLQLIPSAFMSGVAASVWLILPSMKADVADYDELQTGRRREGSLNAFYSWFIKASLTTSVGVSGLVIWLVGIEAKVAAQKPEVVENLFYAYLLIPGLIFCVPLYFLWKYPLNRNRMAAIRGELEQRRGML